MLGNVFAKVAGLLISLCVFTGALSANYVTSSEFTQKLGAMASQEATNMLGVRFDVQSLHVTALQEIMAKNLAVYDKENKLIAKAESATINFSLFDFVRGKTAGAIKEVGINQAKIFLTKKENLRWNFEDLLTEDDKPSEFAGKVSLKKSFLALDMKKEGIQKELSAIDAEVDLKNFAQHELFFDVKNVLDETKASLACDGQVNLQEKDENSLPKFFTVHIRGKNFDFRPYLKFIPEKTLPDNLQILAGHLDELDVHVTRNEKISANGSANLSQGKFLYDNLLIDGLAGEINFHEKSIALDLKTAIEQQRVKLNGRLWVNEEKFGDSKVFFTVQSLDKNGFEIDKVLKNSLYAGGLQVDATIGGTINDLQATGTIKANHGKILQYEIDDASAQVTFQKNRLVVQNFDTNFLRGRVQGEVEIDLMTEQFHGHAMAENLHIEDLGEDAQNVQGLVSANVNCSGKGSDLNLLDLIGTIHGKEIFYKNVEVKQLTASVAMDNGKIVVDHASADLVNKGLLGLEGTFDAVSEKMDLSFFANHVDLSLLKNFDDRVAISGFGNLNATIKGNTTNPLVDVWFMALNGKFFEQPYKTLQGSMQGSADGVELKFFEIKDDEGKIEWVGSGKVGFVGEKILDVRLDTVGARLENIMKVIAPEQKLTGNFDNALFLKGTLNNPYITGFVHVTNGSYNGYLLQEIAGDYCLKDHQFSLQNWHLLSPLVDMRAKGDVNLVNGQMELHVIADTIDLDRFEHKLPYKVHGIGKFDGTVFGTMQNPAFHGQLTSDSLIFNGVELTNVNGEIRLRDRILTFEPFGFHQGDGVLSLVAHYDLDAHRIAGKVQMQQAELNSLLALGNVNTKTIYGKLDGLLDISGEITNPIANLHANLTTGNIGSYDISNVNLNMSYARKVLTLKNFYGHQGENGLFAAIGKINFDGSMKLKFKAKNIALGVLPAAADINDLKLLGSLDIDADVNGSLSRPYATVDFMARDGGIEGSTFDTFQGKMILNGSVMQIMDCNVQKEHAGEIYTATLEGFVPLKALASQTKFAEELEEYDELNLHLKLDHADMGIFPAFSKEIEWSLGALYGDLTINGSLNAPKIYGNLGIKDGSIKFKLLEKPLEKINFGVTCSGHEIFITEGTASMGKGNLFVSGKTKLEGTELIDYLFELNANKLDVQSKYYRGDFQGNLKVTQETFFGKRVPKVASNLLIDGVTISIPMLPDSDGELPFVLLDVSLTAKNTHFYSSSLYDFWVEGSATFGGNTRHVNPGGSFHIRKGTVTYLRTPFTIREGEVYFNQVGSYLPSISFKADTRFSYTRVYLGIEGPVEQMTLSLTSSPAMNRTEIIKLLTFRDAYQNGNEMGSSDWSTMLSLGLQMTFLGDIEDSVKQLLQLDEFRLSQETMFGSKEEAHTQRALGYNVIIGKYISPKVMLQYTHGLNQDVNRFIIRYDFDHRMSAFVGTREDDQLWFGFEGRFSF